MVEKLHVTMNMSRFKSLGTIDEKLEIIFGALIDSQAECDARRKKYDNHFNECNDLIETCNDAVELLQSKIKELKAPEINKKKFFAGGAGLGGISGIAFWEAAKSFFDFLKAKFGG